LLRTKGDTLGAAGGENEVSEDMQDAGVAQHSFAVSCEETDASALQSSVHCMPSLRVCLFCLWALSVTVSTWALPASRIIGKWRQHSIPNVRAVAEVIPEPSNSSLPKPSNSSLPEPSKSSQPIERILPGVDDERLPVKATWLDTVKSFLPAETKTTEKTIANDTIKVHTSIDYNRWKLNVDADSGDDNPVELDVLLLKDNKQKHFRVINAGVIPIANDFRQSSSNLKVTINYQQKVILEEEFPIVGEVVCRVTDCVLCYDILQNAACYPPAIRYVVYGTPMIAILFVLIYVLPALTSAILLLKWTVFYPMKFLARGIFRCFVRKESSLKEKNVSKA
jgi:hypothetical protein